VALKLLKKVSQEELEAIEYALSSTAMETGATQEEINLGREDMLKVATGEWSDEDYYANVLRKYKLQYSNKRQENKVKHG